LAYAIVIVGLGLINGSPSAHGQTLEPRAYVNTPVGMNFLLLGYQNSTGALLFDPAIPITDASARVNMGLLGYVRSLNVAGKSAKAGVLLPYARLYAEGYVDGQFRTRTDIGPADPSLYFTINLYGAPALSIKDFRNYKQKTIIGLAFKLSAPLGAYENDKLINIGTNRWVFKPELGVSQALGRWTLEAAAAVDLYSDNNDFDNGKSRHQEPIYTVQGHVIYSFPNNLWASIGATYYAGGRTTIDGVARNDLQQNWRTGFTLALPINRNQSIKLYGSSGVSTRTGTDYDSVGVAWQYRWGGGF
jgi:hypothetical protein